MSFSDDFRHEIKALLFYLAILGVFLLVVNAKINTFKQEINTTVRVQCLSGNSSTIIGKYNDVVHSLIEHADAVKEAELKTERNKLASENAALSSRLKADLIPIVRQDCSKPFLP